MNNLKVLYYLNKAVSSQINNPIFIWDKRKKVGKETDRVTQICATTVVTELSYSREIALWPTTKTRKKEGVKHNVLDAT